MAWRGNNAADVLARGAPTGVAYPFSLSVWFRALDTTPSLFTLWSEQADDGTGFRFEWDSTRVRAVAKEFGSGSGSNGPTATQDTLWHHAFGYWQAHDFKWSAMDGVIGATNTASRNPAGMSNSRVGAGFEGALFGNVGFHVAYLALWSGDQTEHLAALAAGKDPREVSPQALLACLPLDGPWDRQRAPWTPASGSTTSGCFVPDRPPVRSVRTRKRRALAA